MTPGERKYDIDLAKSMRQQAQLIAKRSRKISDILKAGADRLDALSSQTLIDQPASTPEQSARV